MWKRGDLVELDGLAAIVVGLEGESIIAAEGVYDVPEEHVALWFGDPEARRISQGGTGQRLQEVWLVPAAYIIPAQTPSLKH